MTAEAKAKSPRLNMIWVLNFSTFKIDSDSDNEIDTVGNTSDQELSDDESLLRAPKLRAMSM